MPDVYVFMQIICGFALIMKNLVMILFKSPFFSWSLCVFTIWRNFRFWFASILKNFLRILHAFIQILICVLLSSQGFVFLFSFIVLCIILMQIPAWIRLNPFLFLIVDLYLYILIHVLVWVALILGICYCYYFLGLVLSLNPRYV